MSSCSGGRHARSMWRWSSATDEAPTIGIALCHRKNDALVELTLPKDANIYGPKYQLYLPSKEELRRKLMDWTAEQRTSAGAAGAENIED